MEPYSFGGLSTTVWRGAAMAILATSLSCDSTGPVTPMVPEASVGTVLRGQIVFMEALASDNRYAIFLADSNGVRLKRLSPSGSLDIDPAVSADGKQIAFVTTPFDDAPAWSLYVMNSDGTHRIRLTRDSDGNANQPSWSPDGKRIAFVESWPRISPQIFVVNADGTNLKQLTDVNGGSYWPEWSANGSKILFARELYGSEKGSGLFEMDADGKNVKQLTSGYYVNYPTRSPDGSHIAFVRSLDDGNSANLFIVDADGSNAKLLTGGLAWQSNIAWAPDGRSIAFGITSNSRMCVADDNVSLFACGVDFKRVDLNGTVNSSWLLKAASYFAWRR